MHGDIIIVGQFPCGHRIHGFILYMGNSCFIGSNPEKKCKEVCILIWFCVNHPVK